MTESHYMSKAGTQQFANNYKIIIDRPCQSFLFFSFQDLYRILLEVESKGTLDDVNMTRVEKLILDPDPNNRSRTSLGDVNVMKLKSNVKKKIIDDIDLD